MDCGRLTRLQFLRLGKTNELLIRLVELSLRTRQIKLYHFPARKTSCILHRRTDADILLLCCDILCVYRKSGISKTETKRKTRLLANTVKIAVSHIDSLYIPGIILRAKIPHIAVIVPIRPGCCQLAGRITPA